MGLLLSVRNDRGGHMLDRAEWDGHPVRSVTRLVHHFVRRLVRLVRAEQIAVDLRLIATIGPEKGFSCESQPVLRILARRVGMGARGVRDGAGHPCHVAPDSVWRDVAGK